MTIIALPDTRARRITLGAFQKRLGPMNVFAIDTSSNELCIALRSYLNRFTYIDLDDPDLPNLLGMMVMAAQPAANASFPGSGPITIGLINKVLTDVVLDSERP